MQAVLVYFRQTLLPLVNVGTVAWLLHRLSGVALAVYLIPHFVSVNATRGGPTALTRSWPGSPRRCSRRRSTCWC